MILSRWRSIAHWIMRRREKESELDAEIRSYVEMAAKSRMNDGATPAEAVRLAKAELGGVERIKEEVRAGRHGAALDILAQDIRLAWRGIRRNAGFTAVAVLTLTLGIGGVTAIFSVVRAVLLEPLPYTDPGRLVIIGERGSDGSPSNVGYATFEDWRLQTRTFESMAAFRTWSPTLNADGEPRRVPAMRVSAGFFTLLGIHPALGRDFREDEDTPARWRVLVLSDGLWRRRFHADPGVIGRIVEMNDQSYTIIGVMPPLEPLISEHFYEPAEMWALLGYDQTLSYACRSCQHLKAIGRIRNNVSNEAVVRDVNNVHTALQKKFPSDYPANSTIAVQPLAETLTGNVHSVLSALMGAVIVVLLIACANVTNLLLTRAAGREQDVALRVALGAGRGRIVAQLLVESLMIALMGGVAGIAVAAIGIPALRTLAPMPVLRIANAGIDVPLLVFALLVSIVAAVTFGLLPALGSSKLDLNQTLHSAKRHTLRGPATVARRLLISIDVALAVVLAAGAGLMIQSVSRLLAVNPGFDAEHVLTLQISMGGKAYAQNEAVLAAGDAILDKIRSLPAVDGAALASQVPFGGNGDRWSVHREGDQPSPDDPALERYSVTPDYFSVMGIPLKRGRLITTADHAKSPPVLVIGEHTAQTVWHGQDPIGQRVRIGGSDGPWYTVIGIVGDVHHENLASPADLQMYTAQAQFTGTFLTVVVRSRIDDPSLAGQVRQAVRSAVPDVPVDQVALLSDLVSKSVGTRQFLKFLLEVFGAVALLLTAVGVYGVISHTVTERTPEIGIRVALGASHRNIVGLVMANGLGVVAAGLLAGGVAAAFLTRYLQPSLYAVTPTDIRTFVVVTILLLLVGAVAQLVPAARALRVDPACTLRNE